MTEHLPPQLNNPVFRSPRVLAFGTYNVRKHPRVGILIDGLRANGCIVDQINHPLQLSTSQRVDILAKPWKLFGFALSLLRLWRSLYRDARVWIAHNGKPDAILVGYMGHFDVLLAHHVFKGVPIILDHLIFAGDTAKDRGAQGIKVRMLNKLDRMAIDAATLILLDTREHQSMCAPTDSTMVVPVGASSEWYQAGATHNTSERNGIVFYGLYTPLQGTPIIARAIRELASRGVKAPITLIGNGQDYTRVRQILTGCDNAEFLDWVEPEQLPDLVASHAISLGIFSTTPKGLHVVPNKVYQSLAAGCAVITSGTAPQKRILGDGVMYTIPGDASSLADAIEQLLRAPALLNHYAEQGANTARCYTAQAVTAHLSRWIHEQLQP